MKCSKCGKEFPSIYYFKTDTVCIECFKALPPEEQQKEIFKQLMKHPMTTTTFTIEGYNYQTAWSCARNNGSLPVNIFGTIEQGYKQSLAATFRYLQNFVKNPARKLLI
jgi:hypothetical protein